ncbi:hypothetical protein MNBD_GAMMA12-2822 [hydrothermal vent metagenome]|uniref:Uncharacterized protein n=1 Tax=hydrothermal vent metagenome TaxID=652676 RepID=A0A3B0Z1R7_9ZZZZ
MTTNNTINAIINLQRRHVLKVLVATVVTPMLSYPLAGITANIITPPDAITAPLTTSEKNIISLIVTEIIPTETGSPGAADTASAFYVIGFIETQSLAVVEAIQEALNAVNLISLSTFGTDFISLSPENRKVVVSVIATFPDLSEFWVLVRTLTVLHYYAQAVGYKDIGLPGPNIDRGGYPNATQGTQEDCVTI